MCAPSVALPRRGPADTMGPSPATPAGPSSDGRRYYTGSFSKVVLSQGAVNKVFLVVFLMFLAFFLSKIWAKFHFGTFEPYE